MTYNGKPLVRSGNMIYYGNPEDKYVVTFRLEEQTPLEDLQISKRVIIELKTNEGKKSRLIRQAERDGLYKDLITGQEMEAAGVNVPAYGFFWLKKK